MASSEMRRWDGRPPPLAAVSPGNAIVAIILVVILFGAGTVFLTLLDHQPHSYFGYTICGDGWISHSQGPGTCSHHQGVARYVDVQVTAPPAGWSIVGR